MNKSLQITKDVIATFMPIDDKTVGLVFHNEDEVMLIHDTDIENARTYYSNSLNSGATIV